MRPLILDRVAFDGALARSLVAALDAELVERYDNADEVFPPHRPADYAPPTGAFLVGSLDGQAILCGGLRPAPLQGAGEIKRMYVVPHARGRGHAGRLLEALTACAGELGYQRLVLETGLKQPEAIALYSRAGWRRIPSYGLYRDNPLSVCFGRDL